MMKMKMIIAVTQSILHWRVWMEVEAMMIMIPTDYFRDYFDENDDDVWSWSFHMLLHL